MGFVDIAFPGLRVAMKGLEAFQIIGVPSYPKGEWTVIGARKIREGLHESTGDKSVEVTRNPQRPARGYRVTADHFDGDWITTEEVEGDKHTQRRDRQTSANIKVGDDGKLITIRHLP